VTVLEVIRRGSQFLAAKGVDSPRLQVELLLAHLLQLPRMRLYLNFERALDTTELDALRELIQRRGRREPLQHILGSTSFCGFEFFATAQALVPRPETELLAETGWEFLNSFPAATTATALDFGTGSGCLAVTLALKSPNARIVAIDISPGALALARQNAERHEVSSRLEFLGGDGFSALPPELRFHLIVANPPYIPAAEIASLEPEVREHDPRAALDGGVDGLDFFRRLSREAGTFLKPDGKIMLEFGDGQEEAIRRLFEAQKWIVETVKADYSGQPRILTARRVQS
jgi:release factor glutamine methyltransferase